MSSRSGTGRGRGQSGQRDSVSGRGGGRGRQRRSADQSRGCTGSIGRVLGNSPTTRDRQRPIDPAQALPNSDRANADEEIATLMSQAETMKVQLQTLYRRISAMQAGDISAGVRVEHDRERTAVTRRVAAIINSQCINCGICASVCPEGAITVADATVIDIDMCTGCGACMYECPNEAIGLVTPQEAMKC